MGLSYRVLGCALILLSLCLTACSGAFWDEYRMSPMGGASSFSSAQ
jgi:hypothetical protein